MERIRRQQEAASTAAGRVAFALLVSVALHAALVARMDVGTPRSAPPSFLPVRLHLEPVPPVARAGSEPVTQPRPSAPGASVPAATGLPLVPAAAALAPSAPERQASETVGVEIGTTADLEVPVDPVYYPAHDLDVYPMPLSPLPGVQRADPGRVRLLAMIDETGTVTRAEVFDAQPEAAWAEEAAAILRAVRFSPARKDGQAVRSRVLIEVEFDR